jgi:hypothetical protein
VLSAPARVGHWALIFPVSAPGFFFFFAPPPSLSLSSHSRLKLCRKKQQQQQTKQQKRSTVRSEGVSLCTFRAYQDRKKETSKKDIRKKCFFLSFCVSSCAVILRFPSFIVIPQRLRTASSFSLSVGIHLCARHIPTKHRRQTKASTSARQYEGLPSKYAMPSPSAA